MRVRSQLKGALKAKEILRRLPEAVQQPLLRASLTRAMTPFADAWRATAPRSENPGTRGHGADTIKPRVVDRDLAGAHVSVGPTADRFYLYFDEFGTVKQPARPSARPAWDVHGDGVGPAFIEDLDRGVVRKAREIAGRAS